MWKGRWTIWRHVGSRRPFTRAYDVPRVINGDRLWITAFDPLVWLVRSLSHAHVATHFVVLMVLLEF
jgi:hypothetical protein